MIINVFHMLLSPIVMHKWSIIYKRIYKLFIITWRHCSISNRKRWLFRPRYFHYYFIIHIFFHSSEVVPYWFSRVSIVCINTVWCLFWLLRLSFIWRLLLFVLGLRFIILLILEGEWLGFWVSRLLEIAWNVIHSYLNCNMIINYS